MSKHTYPIPTTADEVDLTTDDLRKWFRSEGFDLVVFDGKNEYVTTFWLNSPVRFNLSKREGYDTFFWEVYGGSLLVFELKLDEGFIEYDCYSPIWLFGIWTIKLNFKRKACSIARYLQEGFEVNERLIDTLNGSQYPT